MLNPRSVLRIAIISTLLGLAFTAAAFAQGAGELGYWKGVTAPVFGSPVFTGQMTGPVTPTDCSAPQYSFTGDTNTGVGYNGADAMSLCAGGTARIGYVGAEVRVRGAINIAADVETGTNSTYLFNGGASVLEQRNSTNAQTFNIYNTTNGTDKEYGQVGFSGNIFSIGTTKAGAGASRSVSIYSLGAINFASNSTYGNTSAYKWSIDTAGNFVAAADNTYDFGASGATRPRNVYVGTSLGVGQAASGVAGVLSLPTNGEFRFGANSKFSNVSDGILLFTNNAGTGFTRMVLGTNDTSGAALKKSGTALQARLGDDSAYTEFDASIFESKSSQITAGSGTGITISTQGLLARQVYKVTIDKTAFICAAVTCDITIGTLPAKTIVESIYADLTQVFACTATCTTATLSMTAGNAAGNAGFLASFDIDAALAVFGDADTELGTLINRANAVQGGYITSFSSTTPASIRLTSGTGNIGTGAATNLSTGSVTFYLITERLP